MKITILNGSPGAQYQAFDTSIHHLTKELIERGHQVSALTLRDLTIRYCTGCWGCWVKTPGECVARDDSAGVARAAITADFLLFASPLVMGFPSAVLKKSMDKLIPLVHPYMAIDQGEIHHLPRYDSYPVAGLLLARGEDADPQDVQLASDIVSRTMLNFKTQLAFTKLTQEPAEAVAQAIVDATWQPDWAPPRQPTVSVERLQPYDGPAPTHLTVFNGSPRGKTGNTQIMLTHFIEGFENATGGDHEMHHLNRTSDAARFREAFAQAECALLGFPLYTDAMPGVTKAFIEALAPLCGRQHNPPIACLVQSGFPEAAHSRYVERYLQKLSLRLGCPYVGTMVKGGGEGVRHMPPQRNQKLFETLQQLGATFGRSGRLDPTLLQTLARPERLPKLIMPLFKLLTKTPIVNVWWDRQLKQNGAYERRFARPYTT